MHAVALLLATSAVLSVCSGDGVDEARVVGTWQLAEARRGADTLQLLADHPLTLAFRSGDDGSAGGSGGCNGFGSAVLIDGDEIEFGQIEQTLMGCGQPRQQIEREYFAALSDVDHLERDGAALTLSGEELTLTYDAVPDLPADALLGPTWRLESIVEDGVETQAEGEATLRIDARDVVGSTGCKTFDGRWDADPLNRVALRQPSEADGVCPAGLTRQTNAILAVMAAFSAAVDGDVLTATGSDEVALVYRSAG